jgi:hypothetical protein
MVRHAKATRGFFPSSQDAFPPATTPTSSSPNPMKTHPLPFSELQAQATKGPFERRQQDLVCSVKSGMVADCEKTDFAKRPSPSQPEFEANAELITRLLNFAHAGGVEALSQVIDWYSAESPNSEAWLHAKAAIAILNGEAK